MKNYNEKKRFSIRKYAVGVVSIVTGITIFIGGNKHMPQKRQTNKFIHLHTQIKLLKMFKKI
ncbi:YSIRK-type signal peptide-containing protein [Staphylococcus capitis]|uniref:YSIRK-type signal peptide-containing protein n=1 Tax=Staphylococcus capitis TaxID=29388 RepID=UPI00201BC218